MKVLIVTNIYPSNEEPNRGVFVQNQVRALYQNGVDAAILLLDYRSLRHNRKIGFRVEKSDDMDVYILSFPISPLHRIQYALADVVTCYAYRRVTKSFGRPDIIHGHFLEGSYGIKKIKRMYKLPCIVTEHGSNVFLFNRTRVETRYMNNLYNKIDRVIFVGHEQQANACDLQLKNSLVIPNVVPKYFEYKELCNRDDKYVFITVANLIQSKRIDVLIRAYNLVRASYPNSKLIIVGAGVKGQELKELVYELGIEEAVEFKGTVKNIDLVDLYNASDCFVLPSIFETFGLVYAEALCCGLPVISANNGGINEIADNSEYVKIVPKDDVNLLFEEMSNITKIEYDRKSISQKYCKKFSEKMFCEKIMSLYTELTELQE